MNSALSRYHLSYRKGFMDGVPVELEEAAWVDGATTAQSIRKVFTPLMFPGICVVFIYTFSGNWVSDFGRRGVTLRRQEGGHIYMKRDYDL